VTPEPVFTSVEAVQLTVIVDCVTDAVLGVPTLLGAVVSAHVAVPFPV
jgi:hypothetical protein